MTTTSAPATSLVTVGEFTFDPTTSTIQGPASYMKSDDYRRCIASIENGSNYTFRAAYEYQLEQPVPSFAVALLVTVQTNYAGWHGMETFNRMRGV